MPPYLTEVETAKQLQVAPETLQQWRHHKRYELPFVKIGRLVRYRQSDIDNWVASRVVTASEPRAFVKQRQLRKAHRAALKAATSAGKSDEGRKKRQQKRHSR